MVEMGNHKHQMANYDYTHINFRGGKHIAGLLFETLMYGKEQYEKRKAYEMERDTFLGDILRVPFGGIAAFSAGCVAGEVAS